MPAKNGLHFELKRNLKNNSGLILLFFLLLIIFRSLIIQDPILNYDDKLILLPLFKITSVHDFISLYRNSLVIDIQPIRDISYIIDISLKKIIPFHSFHLTNLIIFFSIVVLIYKNLHLFFPSLNRYFILWGCYFYALNPVILNSVAWISGRKHLLSTLFVLLATLLMQKNYRKRILNYFFCLFFYLLSIYSHPITLLWPFWFLFYHFFYQNITDKKVFITFLGFLFLCILCGTQNYFYYKNQYLYFSGGMSKILSTEENNLGHSLLSLGRYFFQFFIPIKPMPTSHYPGSIENITGLILFLASTYFAIKKSIKEKNPILFLGLSFFAFLIFPVVFQITNIFNSDTYLLASSFGFLLIAMTYLSSLKINFFSSLISFVVLFFLFIGSFNYINVYMSDEEIWEYSFTKENSMQATAMMISYYNKRGLFNKAHQLINILEVWDPYRKDLSLLKYQNIYSNYSFSIDEKIKKLVAINKDLPSFYFFMALLHYQKKEFEKSQFYFSQLLKDQARFSSEIDYNQELVLSYFVFYCEKMSEKNCTERKNFFISSPYFKRWDEKKYLSLYQDLKKKEQ